MHLQQLDYNTLLEELSAGDANFYLFPPGDQASLQTGHKIFLRHDIDDNIDAAVAMAQEEKRAGAISTYFMLDTAEYFYRSFHKMQHIQELGHEVGWHNNVITQWLKSELSGTMMFSLIETPLHNLRINNIMVRGTASHGDRMCYEHKYVNYEVFDCFPKKNSLAHPQYRLSQFNLEYEAYQFNYGWYLSDSGGKWNVPDPIAYIREWKEKGDMPLQVLVHSQWWK